MASSDFAKPKWITKKFLDELTKDPHHVGLTLEIPKLAKLLETASHYYYNTEEELISDQTFDIIQQILFEKDPGNPVLQKTGAPIFVSEEATKIKLPYWMGSADKIKPNTRELTRWLEKYTGPYMISEKLDGLSGLLIITRDKVELKQYEMALYTRGDGSTGQIITRLLDYLSLSPSKLNFNEINKLVPLGGHLAIRGEIMISKNKFETKYKDQYPKARSLIAGTVNASVKAKSKSFKPEIAKDLEFITYEIIANETNRVMEKGLKFSDQFALLQAMNFNVAKNEVWNKSLDSDLLSELLLKYKKESKYEIDGIIIADSDKAYPRNKSGNPDYQVAFKMSLDEQQSHTKIIRIEWNASKHGVLKPTVIFEPVVIGGDTIQRATAFNADYVYQNKLGPGAVINIIKSGDVIPYIASVIKPANTAQMPEVEWEWNDNHVEALLKNKKDDVNVIIRQITHFMVTLKITGVSEGIISRLYEAGYHDLNTILKLTPDMIASLEGFQLKSAKKIYEAIHSAVDTEIELPLLMDASNCFEGFGERKMSALLEGIPNLMELWDKKKLTSDLITGVSGFSDISAEKILAALPVFKQWLADHPMLKWKLPGVKATPTGTKLKDHVVVMTGFRDLEMEAKIESEGGVVGSSVSGKTTILVVKDTSSSSSKMEKAQKMGITIMSVEEFQKKYY